MENVEVKTVTRVGCSCGVNNKDAEVKACFDNAHKRKSKCKCLRNNTLCSSKLCRCVNCGNGKQEETTEHNTTSLKRSRGNPSPFKRTKGEKYLQREGVKPITGPWTDNETLLLLVITDLLEATQISVTPGNVRNIYSHVVSSDEVKQLGLQLSQKSEAQVTGKITHVRSKQDVHRNL